MNTVKMNGTKERMSTKELTTTAMMIAIVVLMSVTPLGYLRTAGIEVSLLSIPVAIGAMVLGPKVGLILGLTFGLTSFYQCFGMSPFATTLFAVSPLYSFIGRVPTRMLMGWLVGVIFEKVYKASHGKSYAFFVGGFMAAFLNTVFFMSALILCFWNTEFVQGLNQGLGTTNPFAFVVAFVGINGLLEMPASCIVGGVVARTLKKALR